MTYTPRTAWAFPIVYPEPPKAEPAARKPPTCNEVWRKANPCFKVRDAFIVARRNAGDKYAVIAKQVGVSITRTREIYFREVA